jgi:hypothetical protein
LPSLLWGPHEAGSKPCSIFAPVVLHQPNVPRRE